MEDETYSKMDLLRHLDSPETHVALAQIVLLPNKSAKDPVTIYRFGLVGRLLPLKSRMGVRVTTSGRHVVVFPGNAEGRIPGRMSAETSCCREDGDQAMLATRTT